jgi:glycolate oxidase iron-sulfur subunit
MEHMLPDNGSVWAHKLPRHTPPLAASPINGAIPPTSSSKPIQIAFFAGCVGSVMFEKVNRQAVDLLSAAGCDVTVLPESNCCGAMHHHNGLHHPAEKMARANIDAASDFLDESAESRAYIVSTIAGCGAMLRDYDHLLRDDPNYAAKAKTFASCVRDVTELLAEIGLPEMRHEVNLTVTYHDACHLIHAQKVAAQPRAVLAKVPGLKLVPLAEADMCCGAAGTYNLTLPEMATALAERKLRHISATGAKVCVAGNVGCAMHIQSAARAGQRDIQVVHPVEILHQAVFGPS